MGRERPGVALGWKQSEVSPRGGVDGRQLAGRECVAGGDEAETADVRLHEVRQNEVDENIEGRLAEETRPRWCVAI